MIFVFLRLQSKSIEILWKTIGVSLQQKILKNRWLYYAKLHNYAFLKISNVSKYTRDALCCIPSLGFELEALIILHNYENPWFLHAFELQNHGFPWISR